MNDAGEVWVTVPEAARRLGIGERQARRWAGRLPDADRTETGRVRRVRLAAIEAIRAAAVVDADAERSSGGPEAVADRTETGPRPDVSGQDCDARDTLIEQLQLRLADAQADRDAWRTQAGALAERLKDADARLALVAASSGRLQIGPQEPESAPGGESAARDGEGGSTGRLEAPARRSLWARFWGRG